MTAPWVNFFRLNHRSAPEKCPNALFLSRAFQRYPICLYSDEKYFLLNFPSPSVNRQPLPSATVCHRHHHRRASVDHSWHVDRSFTSDVVCSADYGYHTYRGCLADHYMPTYCFYLPITVALTTVVSPAYHCLPHLPRLILQPQLLSNHSFSTNVVNLNHIHHAVRG